MTFATISNLVLTALCIVVVVQSLRMVKGIQQIRSSSLDEGVAQLDAATARAREVLMELKSVLGNVSAEQQRAIAEAHALRDELSVVVGIGNAVAERIVDAASNHKESSASTAPEAEDVIIEPIDETPAPAPRKRASTSRRKSSTPSADAEAAVQA